MTRDKGAAFAEPAQGAGRHNPAAGPRMPGGFEEEPLRTDAQTSFSKAFGEIVLKVEEGSGRISLPKQMDLSALTGLREALLGAIMGSCASIVLDWGAVERCDLFFFQMLCLAQLTCQARGIAVCVEGTLDADLRTAARAMGFGCCAPECLFGAA